MAIHFHCLECGWVNSAAEDLSGTKVECPECGRRNIVPRQSTASAGETSEPSKRSEAVDEGVGGKAERQTAGEVETGGGPNSSAIMIWIVCVLVCVCFIGFVVYMVGFRDSWEKDNFDKLNKMESEARELVQAEDFEGAVGIYEEFFDLIGDRELKKSYVKKVVEDAHYFYADAKEGFEKDLLEEFGPVKKEAERLIEAGFIGPGIRRYEEMLDIIGDYKSENSLFNLFVEALEKGLKLAQAKLDLIQKPEGQEVKELEKIVEDVSVAEMKSRRAATDPAAMELLAKKVVTFAGYKETAIQIFDGKKETCVNYDARYKSSEGKDVEGILSVAITKGPKGWEYKTAYIDGVELKKGK